MQTFAHKNIHIFIYKRIHTYTCVFKKRMSKNDKIRSSTHDYQISVWPWYQGRKNWPIGRNCAFPSTMNRRKSGKKKIHVCEYNIDFWRAVFSSFSNFFFLFHCWCKIYICKYIFTYINIRWWYRRSISIFNNFNNFNTRNKNCITFVFISRFPPSNSVTFRYP